MSGEAMGWQRRQHTGDTGSQYVLLELAMRADECGGMTEIDVDYLAERTYLSRRTIFRCLGTLRDLGLLETETGFTRSGGRRVSGRLVLTASTGVAMRKTQPSEGDARDAEEQGSATVALPDGEVVPLCHQGSATVALPTLCSNSYLNNPPNPPGDERAEKGEREGDDLDVWFEQFQRSYPFDATMRISEARKAAEPLSLKDRAKALRWAAAYAADLKRRGATRPVDAAKWLRERRFADVGEVETAKAQAQGLAKPLVWVVKGTRAWDAWVSRGHKPGLDYSRPPVGKPQGGWWFPSLWPPGVDPPADAGGA